MDDDLEAGLTSLRAESVAMLDRMRILEQLVAKLLNPSPKPSGMIVALKTAASDSHFSTETIRRAALADPAVGTKSGGKWRINMAALEVHLAAKRR